MTKPTAEQIQRPAAPVDRRQRRRQATHDAIRRAALELVAERGLDEVSIEMITERADVGYRTFFNHFPSKEDALVDPGGGRAARVSNRLKERPADETPVDALRASVLAEFEDFDDQRAELCARMAVIECNPELLPRFHGEFAVMERAICEAVAQRTGLDPDRDLYPRLLAAVAGTAMRTCLFQWRADGAVGSPRPVVAKAFDLLAAGLVPPRPRRRT